MPKSIRHMSLIFVEDMAEANAKLKVPYPPSKTRRNLIISGSNAKSLVGRTFFIGRHVLVKAISYCEPCDRPDNLSGQKGFKSAFRDRGGLRVEVLQGGRIWKGSKITV